MPTTAQAEGSTRALARWLLGLRAATVAAVLLLLPAIAPARLPAPLALALWGAAALLAACDLALAARLRSSLRTPGARAAPDVRVEQQAGRADQDLAALHERMMREERINVAGKLAAAVAHEINNPVGVIALYAEHALARLPPGSPVHEHLEVILRNAGACRNIVGGLLSMSRAGPPQRARFDLCAACAEVARSLIPLAEKRGVELRTQGPDAAPLPIEADASELRQAILNLALNAIEATPPGGRVEVRARAQPGVAVLEVEDGGGGVPEADRARIFEPFFTTKPGGTGLGLPVVHYVVERHGGRIAVDAAPAGGALFRVELPLAPAGAAP